MSKIENIVLNVNLSNPTIFFDLDGTTYALLIDGSGKVLDGEMIGIDEDLTRQLCVEQNYDKKTTIFNFDNFSILYCNGEVHIKQ